MVGTRKLMVSVAASILGLSAGEFHHSAVLTTNSPHRESGFDPQNSTKKPVDEETLDAVEFQLVCRSSKSVDDLAKELSKIDRKTIEAALKALLDEDEVSRLGKGTKESPYRYIRTVGCGG